MTYSDLAPAPDGISQANCPDQGFPTPSAACNAPGVGSVDGRQHTTAAQDRGNHLKTRRLLSLFDHRSFQQQFQPDSTILLHGDTADAMYLVVSGTVRCCTIDAEGHRQIFSFLQKGQFLGVSDIYNWHFTAEAVDHVTLRSVSRKTVYETWASDLRLRDEIRAYVCDLLERRESQLLSMVHRKAPERLLGFLKEFAATRPGAGSRPVALPMSRRDIADHLGVSVETISRAFTVLKLKGRIELITPEKYRILPDIASSKSLTLLSG